MILVRAGASHIPSHSQALRRERRRKCRALWTLGLGRPSPRAVMRRRRMQSEPSACRASADGLAAAFDGARCHR